MTRSRALNFKAISLTLVASLMLVGAFMATQPPVASAHPLGNFTINRYARIEPGVGQIQLTYVIDMAEIPTFQEIPKVDVDGDEEVSGEESAAYSATLSKRLIGGLYLSINDSAVDLDMVSHQLSFPPGQGGLPTLRLSLVLQGQWSQRDEQTAQDLYFRDGNYSNRLGWKEIVVKPGQDVSLVNSTVPEHDQSNELRSYSEEMLSSPPDQREARSTFVLAGTGINSEAQSQNMGSEAPEESKDILTSLIANENLSWSVIAISIFVALGIGALHALSPGHGKTIMAAYLVGTRGTAKHAIFLGLTVTMSHTFGVLILGLVVLYASHVIAPERLYPWLNLVSGVIVIGIGVWLLTGRLRSNRKASVPAHRHDEPAWQHHSHSDVDPTASSLVRYYRQIKNKGMNIVHGHSHGQPHVPTREPSHQHNDIPISWKGLTALGLVGGLVPSASAIIIFLAAMSLNRIEFGILLIMAFSAGMAAVLAGVGLLLVYARRGLERFRLQNGLIRSSQRLIPMATTLVVLISGTVVATRALWQMDVI